MPSIAIVLGILGIAVFFFVTERLRVDLVALFVMLGLALTGVLPPASVIRGFSNPAVITIASVLVLSGALTRTGIANIVGRRVIALAGGLTDWANRKNVIVLYPQGSVPRERVFNLKQIERGKIEDPTISGGEDIIVKKRFL